MVLIEMSSLDHLKYLTNDKSFPWKQNYESRTIVYPMLLKVNLKFAFNSIELLSVVPVAFK